MWPLPQLPTDHLYKLIAFVGMATFAGAFYLMDAQRKPFEETGTNTVLRMHILVDRLVDEGLNPKPLAENMSEEEVFGRYNEYRDLIRKLPASNPHAQQLRDMNEQLLVMRIKSRQDWSWQDLRRQDVYTLLFLGGGFLVVGFLLWYYAFQRYQDALMRFSVFEAQQRALSTTSETLATSPPTAARADR